MNITDLLNKIVNNYYIFEQINHYLIYTYKLDHIAKYNSILNQLLKSTRYLRSTFNEYRYGNNCIYRIGKFGKEWDTKQNYPGFYEKFVLKYK
jgi:hypothetical protein